MAAQESGQELRSPEDEEDDGDGDFMSWKDIEVTMLPDCVGLSGIQGACCWPSVLSSIFSHFHSALHVINNALSTFYIAWFPRCFFVFTLIQLIYSFASV